MTTQEIRTFTVTVRLGAREQSVVAKRVAQMQEYQRQKGDEFDWDETKELQALLLIAIAHERETQAANA